MKNLLKPSLFLFLILLSCESVDPQNDDLIYNPEAISDFSSIINDNSENIQQYIKRYGTNEYQANSEIDVPNEEDAKNDLKVLIAPSVEFLIKSGFSEQELISEFQTTESPEIIMMALVTLLKLENDQEAKLGIKNPFSENSIMECLGAASGIKGLWDLATGAAAASRATIIKTFGKFARRSMGWVGAALFMAEFIQCYWGNNNSFES